MNWSRAKTVLIAVLLAVNAFLLVTYVMRENQVRSDEVAVRSDLCKILSAQGIAVSEDTIPSDSIEIRPATRESIHNLKKIAEKLFGSVVENTGEEGIAYVGDGGNVLFSKDTFSLVYESGEEVSSSQDAKKLAGKLALKLNVPTASYDFISETKDGGYVVYIPQVFSGVHVFDCDIEMRISSGGNVLAHGKFLGKGKTSEASGEVMATSALMLSFADAVKTRGHGELRISEINYGYVSKPLTSGVLSLIPTLEIKTSESVFYVDMQTGKLTDI